jgi:hypothetical protein
MRTEAMMRRLDKLEKQSGGGPTPAFTIAWIEAEDGKPTGRYYLTEPGSKDITGPFTGDMPSRAIKFDMQDRKL